MTLKTKGRLILLAVYILATVLGFWASTFCSCGILGQSAVAVVVTVLIIFTGSVSCNNSSVFDPYWSLAPPLMVLFYFGAILQSIFVIRYPGSALHDLLTSSPRILIMFLLTVAYSVRLTWNFLRAWPGLKHEDWRYVGFRNSSGKAYWLVSFSAIHLFPALMVFGGTLSIWAVVVQGYRQFNILDLFALLVTGGAILLEAVSDRQMRNFLKENDEPGKTMKQGLWAFSRHPNYLGEILFWWGLFFFALAANSTFWWVIAGPVAITLMFIFASIPMIEKRMLNRRKDYKTYMERVNMLIPFKFRGNQVDD
ncbi:MAG: DUF1295 domain-containing protein [Bacteroidota bacterium]